MTEPTGDAALFVEIALLRNALTEAMQRLHNSHRLTWTAEHHDWRGCDVSTLCKETARLWSRPLAQAAAELAEAGDLL